MPMTWLEAAVFFHASRQPPGRWMEFAEDRTQQYKRSVEGDPERGPSFLSLAEAYRNLTREVTDPEAPSSSSLVDS